MPRSVAASPPANCLSSPSLSPSTTLGQARAAAPAGLLVCKALGQPLYFPAVCRLGFCLAAAAAASAGAIYCCSFGHASCAATAIVSVYLFTFALYYSPLT